MITCYRDLHRFLRLRADSLGISRGRIDEIAGLPDRFAAKVLAPDMPRVMSLDVALAIVGALGCTISIIEDPAAMQRIAESLGSRVNGKVTASRKALRARKERKLLRDMARRANLARHLKTTPEQRSNIATRAALARWAKARKIKRQRRLNTL